MTNEQIILAFQVTFPFLVAIVSYLYKIALSKMSPAQRAQATDIVKSVVQAVEQSQSGLPGPNKKVQAMALINSLLAAEGVKVAPELVDVLLESAVLTIQKQLSDTTVRLPVVR